LYFPRSSSFSPSRYFRKLFARTAVRQISRKLRRLEYDILDKDRTIHTERQGQRIRRPRIDADHLASTLQPDNRIKRILAQLCHHHLVYLGFKAGQYILDQIVRHGRGVFTFSISRAIAFAS